MTYLEFLSHQLADATALGFDDEEGRDDLLTEAYVLGLDTSVPSVDADELAVFAREMDAECDAQRAQLVAELEAVFAVARAS